MIVHLPDPTDPWNALWASFERGLRADSTRITSRRTLEIYAEAGRQFHEFQLERHSTVDPAHVEKLHVENWLIYLREERGVKPATIRARFSALRRFFNWCVDEGEVEHSPMLRMHAPKVDEPAPDVLTDAEANKLLKACEDKDFESRRDRAIIGLMLDTGLRRFEVAAMGYEAIKSQLDSGSIQVMGKGSRQGIVFFGVKTARDIDRYLRVRAQHRLAADSSLWLAQKGALTGDGVHHLVKRRAALAGIRAIHPHLFRHTWANAMKAGGASDEDVMTLGRWRDRKIMARYGASAAIQRAAETARRLSPRDRLT
ncbi:MAG TPA: tyrosine-type recombinase/integrase [Candidatus Nitrosotalea sp.]|nr:tyrosine-type recombinase/integrase [Candidatus Nitrosotalea sp.]